MDRFLKINRLGVTSAQSIDEKHSSIILRVRNKDYVVNGQSLNYPHLTYAGPEFHNHDKLSSCDIIVVTSFVESKQLLQRLSGRNIGFEVLISKIKYMKADEIGKWFSDVKYLYELCRKYKQQLILSSGAKDFFELASLRTFNTILAKLNISSSEYWDDLNKWLNSKLRGSIFDFN
jgi:hypothetical protein